MPLQLPPGMIYSINIDRLLESHSVRGFSSLVLLQNAVYIDSAVLMDVHYVFVSVNCSDNEEDHCTDEDAAHDR